MKKLQQTLNDLGYWNGTADGTFGELTRQAVMAYQSVADIGVDGVAGEQTLAAIADKARPQPRTTSGDAIEIDKDQQIVMVVVGGELEYAFHTSTGSGETYLQKNVTEPQVASTPSGEFSIERAIDGNRISPLGELWRPRYFVDGIALHGSSSVPNHPASHGCVRLTNETIDLVWSEDLAPIGRTVLVY